MRLALTALLVLVPAVARADGPPPAQSDPVVPLDPDPPANGPVQPIDPDPPAPAPTPTPAPVVAPDYYKPPPPPGKDIVIEAPGERTNKNVAEVSALLAVGLGIGALGLYYNLDARNAANALSANVFQDPTTGELLSSGKTWTAAREAQQSQAASSSTKAEIFYPIGGAIVIGAIVAFILTEPPAQRSVIHTHPAADKPQALISPTQGGAVVGGTWRF